MRLQIPRKPVPGLCLELGSPGIIYYQIDQLITVRSYEVAQYTSFHVITCIQKYCVSVRIASVAGCGLVVSSDPHRSLIDGACFPASADSSTTAADMSTPLPIIVRTSSDRKPHPSPR